MVVICVYMKVIVKLLNFCKTSNNAVKDVKNNILRLLLMQKVTIFCNFTNCNCP